MARRPGAALSAFAFAVAIDAHGARDHPPAADRAIGLLRLSEILYPDLFRCGYRKEVARRFYHQAPSEEQLTRLLGEPGVAPR